MDESCGPGLGTARWEIGERAWEVFSRLSARAERRAYPWLRLSAPVPARTIHSIKTRVEKECEAAEIHLVLTIEFLPRHPSDVTI